MLPVDRAVVLEGVADGFGRDTGAGVGFWGVGAGLVFLGIKISFGFGADCGAGVGLACGAGRSSGVYTDSFGGDGATGGGGATGCGTGGA